jgi:hypothetical protein
MHEKSKTQGELAVDRCFRLFVSTQAATTTITATITAAAT